jgi:hypothetical protein
MSLETFFGTLKRIRKERYKTATAATRIGSVESGPDTPKASHAPTNLKDIFRSELDLDALAKLQKKRNDDSCNEFPKLLKTTYHTAR